MSITAIVDSANPPTTISVGDTPSTILLSVEADGSVVIVFLAIPSRTMTANEVAKWVAENPTVDRRSVVLKVTDRMLLADLGTAATAGFHHIARHVSDTMGEAKGHA